MAPATAPAPGAPDVHAARAAADATDDGPAAEPLPEPLRQDLLRMARQGAAAGLRQRLRAARAEAPGSAALLDRLQACADRFDFQTLADHLREPDHDDTEPTPA